MGKVIYDMAMSLDGFVSGTNVRPEAGLGDGGERLHEWASSSDPQNQKIIASWASIGAIITGRTTYNLSVPYWGADGPMGEARVPTVVVSHSMPDDVPYGNVYTFVNKLETAIEVAKKIAGDKDISMAGANIAQQCIQLGLIDEISIHVTPVLFGSGTPLFGNLDGNHISLETIEVIGTAEVIYMRFRVEKFRN